ncbi:MAG: mycofactocin radical SAM maturase [Deltaproteobacteria bacterium]|nr:mycofactocin radical SAM maturase [Deltaproteobacteria bacterium]
MGSSYSKNGLRAPVNATWEITLKCNLHCAHCLSDSGQRVRDEMSFVECKHLIDELVGLNVFQVNIGGGEPFIRPDFLDLLDYAHRRGLVTCVSTNGTLMDGDLARRLALMKRLYLQVSLDGVDAEVNDRIRGRGTYGQIIAAMEFLSSAGARFSVNTVLTRLSYPQLDDLRSLAGQFGAELRVSRFRPSGRGKGSRSDLAPSTEQLENFASWLDGHDMVRTGDSFFCLTSENRRRKGLDMCGAAKMTCCISPNGNIYPCAFLQEPAFLCGNVRQEGFQSIWEKSRIMHSFRELEVETCVRCERFEHCRGGCPAMAYHTYRDISMPDPECLVNIKTAA